MAKNVVGFILSFMILMKDVDFRVFSLGVLNGTI